MPRTTMTKDANFRGAQLRGSSLTFTVSPSREFAKTLGSKWPNDGLDSKFWPRNVQTRADACLFQDAGKKEQELLVRKLSGYPESTLIQRHSAEQLDGY
jgi:hypothetical protein